MMKNWWQRIKLIWKLGRNPRLPQILTILTILESTDYQLAKLAVEKNKKDLGLKMAHNDLLRLEAISWANAYAKEERKNIHPWILRIAVELAVGELKGYFENNKITN